MLKGLTSVGVPFGLCVAFVAMGAGSPEFEAVQISNQNPFPVRYGPVSPGLRETRNELVANKVLEEFANAFDQGLKLPRPLELALEECGEGNAFYDPARGSITMCYELLVQLAAEGLRIADSEEELELMTGGTVAFALGHELGHALIDILALPATGREEDAADQLATLTLAGGSEEAVLATAYAAAWFYRMANAGELREIAFADEHSLGQQRFYNILCWL